MTLSTFWILLGRRCRKVVSSFRFFIHSIDYSFEYYFHNIAFRRFVVSSGMAPE